MPLACLGCLWALAATFIVPVARLGSLLSILKPFYIVLGTMFGVRLRLVKNEVLQQN